MGTEGTAVRLLGLLWTLLAEGPGPSPQTSAIQVCFLKGKEMPRPGPNNTMASGVALHLMAAGAPGKPLGMEAKGTAEFERHP